MKRAWIALLLLLFLSLGCSWLSRRLVAASEELSARTAALEASVRQKTEDRAAALRRLTQGWQEQRAFLIALSGHTNCEPIETVIASLEVWNEAGEDAQLLAALSQLSTHLDQLRELQTPSLANLF